jgi:hypothetical protein
MGWTWVDIETSARRVAEHCAKKMYSEEEVKPLLEALTIVKSRTNHNRFEKHTYLHKIASEAIDKLIP